MQTRLEFLGVRGQYRLCRKDRGRWAGPSNLRFRSGHVRSGERSRQMRYRSTVDSDFVPFMEDANFIQMFGGQLDGRPAILGDFAELVAISCRHSAR